MPHMSNVIGLLEKLESRNISVHQHRCVRVRNRNATCARCAEACTSGCISYGDNELFIAPEKCVGCGTCATVCPTCALEAHRPNDAELLQTCLRALEAAEGESVIACERVLETVRGLFDSEKVVSVRCLGRVEESLLVELALAGASRITLVRGVCEECSERMGIETAELTTKTAATLLDTWNLPIPVGVSRKFPSVARKGDEAGYDAARRGFFASMRDEAADVAKVTASYAVEQKLDAKRSKSPKYLKVMADGTLPHFIPDRRERLLNALAELGEPRDELIETRLWGHVIIDPALCSSCRMCATFCPTGAIAKFDDADGTMGVEHFPGDCVKCRCCEDICREGALTISDEVFAVDLLSGAVERYEMVPAERGLTEPHSVLKSMRSLIGVEQIYER